MVMLALKPSSQGERIHFLLNLMKVPAQEPLQGFQEDTWKRLLSGDEILSAKIASFFCTIARNNRVFCTPEWLLWAEGNAPFTLDSSEKFKERSDIDIHNEQERCLKEIRFFFNCHDEADVFLVMDDAMAPHYGPGDYVGGVVKPMSSLRAYLGRPCIVETEDQRRRLRCIGYQSGTLFLYGFNTRYNEGPLFEMNPNLRHFAPIFWQRMREI